MIANENSIKRFYIVRELVFKLSKEGEPLLIRLNNEFFNITQALDRIVEDLGAIESVECLMDVILEVSKKNTLNFFKDEDPESEECEPLDVSMLEIGSSVITDWEVVDILTDPSELLLVSNYINNTDIKVDVEEVSVSPSNSIRNFYKNNNDLLEIDGVSFIAKLEKEKINSSEDVFIFKIKNENIPLLESEVFKKLKELKVL